MPAGIATHRIEYEPLKLTVNFHGEDMQFEYQRPFLVSIEGVINADDEETLKLPFRREPIEFDNIELKSSTARNASAPALAFASK